MKKTNTSVLALAFVSASLLFSACSTPRDIAYMQDLDNNTQLSATHRNPIKVRPGDKISIIVKSKDPELSDLFNLPTVSYRVGQGKASALTSNQNVQSYLVDRDGNVDFPILGNIHVAGLQRDGIARLVKQKLIDSNLLKDPVVTVDFDNLSYAVLGEVANPGQFVIDRDEVSIYDAIAKAGDLTIYGNRRNVKVQRREGDAVHVYTIDLTSGQDAITSPAYCLQQNDIVYVTPNDTRQRQSTVNGNNSRSASFWISVSSLAATIAAVVISSVK